MVVLSLYFVTDKGLLNVIMWPIMWPLLSGDGSVCHIIFCTKIYFSVFCIFCIFRKVLLYPALISLLYICMYTHTHRLYCILLEKGHTYLLLESPGLGGQLNKWVPIYLLGSRLQMEQFQQRWTLFHVIMMVIFPSSHKGLKAFYEVSFYGSNRNWYILNYFIQMLFCFVSFICFNIFFFVWCWLTHTGQWVI